MRDDVHLWLSMTDAEIAHGCMAEWRYDRQLIVEEDEPGFQRRDSFPAKFALDVLVATDPQRALKIAFRIARSADNDGDFIALGVGPLTSLVAADPALWKAVETEVDANPKLLRAVGQIYETVVPDGLRAAHTHSIGR
jgi:hypothetical protein